MKEFSLSPNQLSPNQNISVSVSFLNRGNKPLVAPKRVGIKDEPASYSLAVWFINKNTAEEEKRIIEPQIPTTQWYGGYPFPTTPPDNPVRIVRGDVLSPQKPGRYEVRIALENSHPGIHQGETWPIITNQQADTQGRYFIGEIQVN